MFGALLWWNKKAISDPKGSDLATKLQNRTNDPALKPLMFLFSAYGEFNGSVNGSFNGSFNGSIDGLTSWRWPP